MSRQASLETITGQYVGPGVICPRFRLSGGETISLSGPLPELQPGQDITLTGRWSVNSKCMQGREFRVIPEG
jgi:hypothetical protein